MDLDSCPSTAPPTPSQRASGWSRGSSSRQQAEAPQWVTSGTSFLLSRFKSRCKPVSTNTQGKENGVRRGEEYVS
ncbi:hypothetical protein J4Q44_G00226040 [Coregonus suidteri]|uniref:Uncharacterized protein n=1 Tax=Coregonus suidteri TaxID=861788 RepID=A0AAN8LSW3_9TELE